MVAYSAKVTPEDGRWLIEFPDCPGCQTFVETEVEIIARAREALEGWLEATLEMGHIPPQPAATEGRPIVVTEQLALGLRCLWTFRQRIQCVRLAFDERSRERDEQGMPEAAVTYDAAEKLLGLVVREFNPASTEQMKRQYAVQHTVARLHERKEEHLGHWTGLIGLVSSLEKAEDVVTVTKAALDLEYQLTGDTAYVGPLADLLGVPNSEEATK